MKSAEMHLGIEGERPSLRQGFGEAREGRSSAFVGLPSMQCFDATSRRDKMAIRLRCTSTRQDGVGARLFTWPGPSNSRVSRISQDLQCEIGKGKYYESYDNGLTRSRSLGPRGPLALLRFLSPLPKRLKSTNLQFEHYPMEREILAARHWISALLASGIGMARNDSRLRKLRQDAAAIWGERFHPETEMSRRHKILHFCVLVVKSFYRNGCLVRASALTYATLLALIPMLAVAIGVTNSLFKNQGEDEIYRFVDKMVSSVVPPAPLTNVLPVATGFVTNTPTGATNSEAAETETNSSIVSSDTNQSVTEGGTNTAAVSVPATTNAAAATGEGGRTAAQKEAARSIHEFIQNTRHARLGTWGVIFLILAGIFLLGQIETTLNDIWGVAHSRNLWSHVQIYCTAIIVGPALLAGAAALTSGPHLEATQRLIARMPIIGPVIFPTLTLIVLWLTFALFYEFVPNTKVRFSAAAIGGVVAGTVWHANNLLGFIYVSRVVSNGTIYGRLGLLPVFMLGIYFSWVIVLFGAQVSYAFQNRALYFQERLAENVNQRGREFVALRLMTCIGQRFQRGLRPQTGQEMSDELCVPSRLVQQLLQTLVAAHLVIEVSGPEAAYTPGRPLEQINAHHILQAMRARGQELMTRDEPVRQEVYGEFARIEEAEKAAASSITMLALVHRAEGRVELAPAPEQTKEIEMTRASVLKEANKPEPASQPEQSATTPPVEVVKTVEPIKPEPVPRAEPPQVATEAPEPKPVETVAESKPSIAEPMPDEEREFPL